LAGELKTPEAIYDYVVKTLKYDFNRTAGTNTRYGALNALESPDSAVCREFTDLFIALARAGGIPTREVNGFAYTANTKQRPLSLSQDVLHAWPEYYDSDKRTWIMVDPTWGSTTGGVDYFNTLDFDHIAFVVKGSDDTYPIPAGGYKSQEQKTLKDVNVSFASGDVKHTQIVDLTSSLAPSLIAGMPINYDVKIVNNGPGTLMKTPLYIDSSGLVPAKQAFEIPEIPPFGQLVMKNSFDKTSFLTKKRAEIKIRYEGKTVTKSTKISPFFNFFGIGGN
jgi:hypothetical protein